MVLRAILLFFLQATILLVGTAAGADASRASKESTSGAPLEVTGRAVTSQGQAIEGGLVSLYAALDRYRQGRHVVDGDLHAAPVATTRTDAEGQFRFDVETTGQYTLVVEQQGLVPWEYPLALVQSVALPTVALTQAREHPVRVLDQDGRAIDGAFVMIGEASRWSRRSEAFGDWLPAAQLARSDEDGDLAFARESVRGVDLVVWAPGFVERELSSGKRASEVRLERGTTRRVEVREASGRPAPGVLVRVGTGAWPAGTTDENGRLELAAPRDRSLPLELVAEDGLVTRVDLLPAASMPADAENADAETPETFYLRRAAVEGRVLGAESGDGVADALLWVGGDRGLFARSDARGVFRLPVADPSAPVQVFAEAPRHLGQRTDGWPKNADGAVEVALDRAVTIPGRVVDENGRPVASAELQVHTDLGRNHFLEPSLPVAARSDADGRFRLDSLPAAPLYEVIVRARGFAAMRWSTERPANGDGIELVLRRGVTAAGRVLDAEGRPLRGASTFLYPSRDFERDRLLVDDVHATQSQVDGSFALPNVLAGRYELGVSAPGHAPTIVRGLELGDAATGLHDLGTVYLERQTILEGRVVDPDGRPLRGVAVSYLAFLYEVGPADDQLSTLQVTQSDADGRFVVEGLLAGDRVDLKLRRAGFETRQVFGVEVPTPTPFEVVLEPTALVSGRVVDGAGDAVASAQVVMEPRGEGWSSEEPSSFASSFATAGARTFTTDSRGRFALESADSGHYVLRASAEGYLRSPPVEIEIRGDHSSGELLLVLGEGARLAGRVLDEAGRPVVGARLRVTDPAPRPAETAQEARTRGDGSYQLEGLGLGPTTVEIRHRDFPREVRELRLNERLHRLDVTLEAGFEVSGWVRDAAGAPVAGARLRLEGADQHRRSAISGTDGELRFVGLPPGTYRISATKERYADADREVTIDAGGVVGGAVELVLEEGATVRGQVLGLDAVEISRVRVEARRPGFDEIEASVDYEGGYRLEHLAVGPWIVEASLPSSNGRRATASLTIEDGAPETWLELDFEAGLELDGEVWRAGGPVGGVLVAVVREDLSMHRSGRSNRQGQFHFTGLDPGVYELIVRDLETGLSHQQVLELASDREVTIDLSVTSPPRSAEPTSP